MREFIKKGIQSRLGVEAAANTPEAVSNETILEYASLFQELDDLSNAGTQAGETRKLGMDIPLDDDDIEVESIEFNIGDGKVGDVRGDNTAPTSIAESYEGMKTFDHFYQEAYDEMTRLPRESEDGFARRVNERAEKMYQEYCEEAEACGYFGFDKINIGDNRVPSRMNVNFGKMDDDSSDNFVTKVNTFFATDEAHNITKKQLDSVQLVKSGALKNMGTALKSYMECHYDVPHTTSVWDMVTPKTLIVPKGNADSFCVVVEYTNEITGKNEYFGWTAPVYTENKDSDVTIDSCERFNMESFYNETHYENHDKYVQEAAALRAELEEKLTHRVRPNRFFQEAIEGLEAAPAEGDAAPAPADPADAGGDVTPAPDDSDKKVAAVNDVSSQIADKIANDTQNNAEADAETVTFSDETNPDANVNVADGGDIDETAVEGEDDISADDDLGTDDAGEIDADAELDNLDDMSADAESETDDLGDEDLGDEGEGALDTENVDDMTVNQLLELGKESLKNMKVGDLKNMIANDQGNETITEAFILTPKNVAKEIDIKLRRCLGILNDNAMDIDKLLGKFRLEGHKLNRTLSKAAKITKIFSSDEIASIKKLNSALGDLLVALRKKGPENYGTEIKNKIKAFTKEAKVVGAIVEDKMNEKDDKVTQEAFLLSNINDKLTKALIPVKADMMDLSEKHVAGQLTRGRIIKKYASANNNFGEYGNTTRTSNMTRSTDMTLSGYNKNAKKIDDALKLLNKAIRKNADKIELITQLADKIDIISDYIETVIDDKNENKEYINMIGKLAGEIVELIDQYIGDDGSTSNVEDTSLAEAPESEPIGEPLEENDDILTEDVETSSDETSTEEAPEEEEKSEEESEEKSEEKSDDDDEKEDKEDEE